MVPIGQHLRGLFDKVLLQVGDFVTYPHGTEGSFPPNIGVRGGYEVFDLGEEVSGHFDGGDVA